MVNLFQYLLTDDGENGFHQFRRIQLHYPGQETNYDGYKCASVYIDEIVAGLTHQFTAKLIQTFIK